ncbi:MAG: nucleotidyl transferase AbiEii/AbiGii toxin family protein, partial [Gemmatimonadales bacterium]
YAIERFLYRLGDSPAASRCVLKGAALLAAWLSAPYRTTRDVDFLATGAQDDDGIRRIIEEACAIECPDDAVRYDLTGLKIESIRNEEEYSGKRATFAAYLGKALIRVQVDFGFGDAMTIAPIVIEYPTMLDHLPKARIRGYARETTIAEKFEAAVKLGTTNSRMKDFHDIWGLSGAFAFDGAVLQPAVVACFDRRGTRWPAETPSALTAAFYADPTMQAKWAGYARKNSVAVAPAGQFGEIGEQITTFLRPIRDSIASNTSFHLNWPAGGPWK